MLKFGTWMLNYSLHDTLTDFGDRAHISGYFEYLMPFLVKKEYENDVFAVYQEGID